MTDLWRCTVCGQVSTVGRCCGEETREPWRPIRRKDEEETRRIEAVADRAEQLEAEIEALRAKVGELHMHAKRRDQYAAEKAAQALDWKRRAERLAEALRHQRWCRTCAEDGWESCEEGRKNDALLRDQEEDHEQ